MIINLNMKIDHLLEIENCPDSVFCLSRLTLVIFGNVIETNISTTSSLLFLIYYSCHSQTHYFIHIVTTWNGVKRVSTTKSTTLSSSTTTTGTTRTTTILHSTTCKIVLIFITIFTKVTRFVTIVTNWFFTNVSQNHRCRASIGIIPILAYILIANRLSTTTKTSTIFIIITIITIVITLKYTITMLLQYTVSISHERLVSTLSK